MAENERPDPDELQARVKRQEAWSQRGQLKIFFGSAAGVGKTYAMLETAQTRQAEGVDVVVGYVEPPNRPETEALLKGLEIILPQLVEYRGAQLRDAARGHGGDRQFRGRCALCLHRSAHQGA